MGVYEVSKEMMFKLLKKAVGWPTLRGDLSL